MTMPLQPYNWSGSTALVAAVANQYVTTANMANGAYSLANSTPPSGTTNYARLTTITHTTVAGQDTLGLITVVGTKLDGSSASDVITPVAGGTATGVVPFKSITSITSSGWAAVSTADTITAGCAANGIVCDGSGILHSIIINTTAAGAIVVKDANGTIATLKSSIGENTFYYDVYFKTFLAVNPAAASDITVTFYRIGA